MNLFTLYKRKKPVGLCSTPNVSQSKHIRQKNLMKTKKNRLSLQWNPVDNKRTTPFIRGKHSVWYNNFLFSVYSSTVCIKIINFSQPTNLFVSHSVLNLNFFFLCIISGVKRVTWPPEHEYQARSASQTRQSPAIQPQVRAFVHFCFFFLFLFSNYFLLNWRNCV